MLQNYCVFENSNDRIYMNAFEYAVKNNYWEKAKKNS